MYFVQNFIFPQTYVCQELFELPNNIDQEKILKVEI